jgi:hypothetical protein
VYALCGAQSVGYALVSDGKRYPSAGLYCCQEDDPCHLAGNGTCDCFGECGFDRGDCGAAASDPACRGVQAGDCGDESWMGRCVGDTLVYCASHAGPERQVVIQSDCAATGRVCAYNRQDGYHQCVERRDPCGGVPTTGTCVEGGARFCAAGVVHEIPCADRPCGPFTLHGVDYEFCSPCAAPDVLQSDGTCAAPAADPEVRAPDAPAADPPVPTKQQQRAKARPAASPRDKAGCSAGSPLWLGAIGLLSRRMRRRQAAH